MMLVSNFFTVGAAIGGFIAAGLDPALRMALRVHLWRDRAAGVSVLMIFLLPESLQFLVLRGKSKDKVLQVAAAHQRARAGRER